MLTTAACMAAACLAAPVPQGNQDEFTVRQAQGITLKYSIEMTAQDADALLANLQTTREVMRAGLGIPIPFDPVVTVRRRKDCLAAYYTDGVDQVSFDFPSENYVRALQYGDEKIFRYSVPSFLQLWLFRSLSSTAGLDPRVLQSLSDYAMHLLRVEGARSQPDRPAPVPPTGPAQLWLQIEELYPGTTTFLLNSLSAEKVRAHLLGAYLRDVAVAATEDPSIARFFDMITPPEPIFSATEFAPGAPLLPTSPLCPGRLALFNGTPILDAAGEPIDPTERTVEFDRVFQTAAVITPAGRIVREPPAVGETDLWPLYFEFRPRIQRAADNLDYYVVLREFLGRFHDRAIGFKPTPALPVPPGTPMWSSVAGVAFVRTPAGIFVSRVAPESEPAKAGIVPGLEIVTVDGRSAGHVHDLLTQFVWSFDSSPSMQRAKVTALDNLLAGVDGTECEIGTRSGGGEIVERRLKRGLPPPPRPVALTVEVLDPRPDEVGVMRINYFGGDGLKKFVGAVEELVRRKSKAIVIDLRGNEGFVDTRVKERAFLAMLGRLLPQEAGKIVVGTAVSRKRESFADDETEQIVVEPTPGIAPYEGPVAILTDAWTGGEAEWFVLAFQLAKRGRVVGTTTAGSVSLPKEFENWQSLRASRIEVSFSRHAVVRPDRSPLQSVGILPQVEVIPTPADLAAGRDAALERAAALLLEDAQRSAKSAPAASGGGSGR